MSRMTEEKAMEMYHGHLHCSQVVFGYGCELIGLDPELGYKVGAGFGGGMFRGETCGCVTGALMALGLQYGHYKMDDAESEAKMMEMKKEFEDAFIAEHGSLICKEILEYDISKPEELEKIMQLGLLDKICPKLAVTACELLDELL